MRLGLLILALLAALAVSTGAKAVPTVSYIGRVLDSNGMPVAGAEVFLKFTDNATGETLSSPGVGSFIMTDANGFFVFTDDNASAALFDNVSVRVFASDTHKGILTSDTVALGVSYAALLSAAGLPQSVQDLALAVLMNALGLSLPDLSSTGLSLIGGYGTYTVAVKMAEALPIMVLVVGMAAALRLRQSNKAPPSAYQESS